jgi:hypothetical protein
MTSVKDRLNSVLMKTLSENAERDRPATINVNSLLPSSNSTSSLSSVDNGPMTVQPQIVVADPTVMKALRSVKVIANARECRSIVSGLLTNNNNNDREQSSGVNNVGSGAGGSQKIKSLQELPLVCGVDGQGVNSGPDGSLTLLSVVTMDGKIYVFDVMVCPELVTDGQLKMLMEDEGVVKVS